MKDSGSTGRGPVIAVVQARMSSARFPGKMLAQLGSRPLALWSLDRAARAASVDAVILATSDSAEDDALARVAVDSGYRVHRGSLEDVLARVVAAARAVDADVVVRLTGDCPLLEPEVIDRVVEAVRADGVDYASNVQPPSWPDGLDCEALPFAVLEEAEREADDPHDREHVTTFVRSRPDRYRQANIDCPYGDRSDLHWSVDTPGDLALVEDLIAACTDNDPDLHALLAAVDAGADLAARSRAGKRNEGAAHSLNESMDRRRPPLRVGCSNELWQRATAVIPGATQTCSKGADQFCFGFGPRLLERGEGSHVWDVDGNEFIDYPLGLGPVTLGHAHPEVVEAIRAAAAKGSAMTLPTEDERVLAEMIVDRVPCAEMVRFGKNGSDATAGCIRAARALTGRDHVLRHGYHGWQDWCIDETFGIRRRGVPEAVRKLIHPFPYGDLTALRELLDRWECAAVIMEPVNLNPPAPGYLEGVRDLATRYGALLVFDEVITGFRYARGGAQEYFGVTPDLAAMGKGVANGAPLSVVCGRRDCMRVFEDIFFSFTFGGDRMALAAARVTLEVMEREGYWDHIWRLGAILQREFDACSREFGFVDAVRCAGLPPWTITVFADAHGERGATLKTLFQQEMLRRGILFTGSQFISLSHTEADIERTVSAYHESFRVLREAIDHGVVGQVLRGAVNRPVFRRG